MFPCIKCHFSSRRFRELLNHYRFIHCHENGFAISCGVNGCQSKYKLVPSLLKHIKRKHPVFHSQHISYSSKAQKDSSILSCLQEFHDESMEDHDQTVTNQCQEIDENVQNSQISVDYCKQLALFLLKLREQCKLPANSVSLVVDEISNLICLHQAEVSLNVKKVLKEQDVEEELFKVIENSILQDSGVESACQSLNSVYRLNQYIAIKMNMVKPVEYILGEGANGKSNSMEYIPVLNSLKQMLKHDDVFSYVMNSHRSDDDILRDICDGKVCSQNTLFGNRNSKALQILLFFDEFTVTNPIGHSIKQYKIGAFYMLLANIPPKYRSHLNTIQLVALVKGADLKQYGFSTVLAPLMHDLKILESDGVCIERPEGNMTFNGSIIAVIGDNLGAHSIGGFVESFTTQRYCRFCFLPRPEMQKKVDSSGISLRTIAMYNQQLELVQNDPNLSTVYGLKKDSVLNELDFFHVIGGMPSDLAHDLFEGVVPYVMKLVVIHCVRNGYFTLQYLNEQINGLTYSDFDKTNRPGTVPSTLAKFKISQSASQTWCFFRLLPMMVADQIPYCDSKWEVLLLLQDVVFFVCANSIKKSHVPLIKDAIEDFLEAFCHEFPDENLKPKFHFLLHYPDQILRYGPLLHIQTLRFEAKHSYFKELAQRTKCKKNICKSLAIRHQTLQCISNESRDFLKSCPTESVGGSLVPLVLLQHRFQDLLQPHTQNLTEIFQCKSVRYNSVLYTIGCCIVIGHEEDHYKFCKIEQCFIVNNAVLVLGKQLEYIDYKRHLNAHIVKEINDYVLIDLRNVTQPCTLGMYKTGNTEHIAIIMKYKLLF